MKHEAHLSRILLCISFGAATIPLPEEIIAMTDAWKPNQPPLNYSVLGSCEWGSYSVKGRTAPFCLRSTNDVVSDYIKRKELWDDCYDLPALFHHAQTQLGDRRVDDVFIDVGANIGACVVHMLLSFDDLRVVALEPSGDNLFYLTSTLHRMWVDGTRTGLHERVLVLPIASTEKRESDVLVVGTPGNAGNTHVEPMREAANSDGSKKLEDMFKGSIRDEMADTKILSKALGSGRHKFVYSKIQAFPLSDIFDTPKIRVPLMKVDVQGSECRVFKGAAGLLKSGRVFGVKFEAWEKGLDWQMCGTMLGHQGILNLLSIVRGLGFATCIERKQLIAQHTERAACLGLNKFEAIEVGHENETIFRARKFTRGGDADIFAHRLGLQV